MRLTLLQKYWKNIRHDCDALQDTLKEANLTIQALQDELELTKSMLDDA